MENQALTPPPHLSGKFHYFFFWNPSLRPKVLNATYYHLNLIIGPGVAQAYHDAHQLLRADDPAESSSSVLS